MEALFLKLVNMSISASWLVLAVVVLRFAMKKAPKWMTCALWALVAIRLVFPFSIESTFSLIPEPVSSGQLVENATDDYWGTTHIYHDNREEYQTAVEAGRKPIHAGEGHYYVVTAEDGISEPPTVANTVIPVLSDIWIVGVILLVIYAVISYLLIRRKVSASLHLRENIYLCDYIESPFILGILRPRIYLPSTLDQSQWPHVIAHEQAHLARRDHWWKPLGFVILCVYWFNPVLWLAYILLCRDIELACDERVIRDMDTRQKQDYTTALLECSMPRYLIAACPLAFGEVGVKERVKSVLNYKKPAFWIILIALVLCIAAAVCFLTDPVGNNTITPGTYNIEQTLYFEPYADGGSGVPTIPDGQYILQDNTLYCDGASGITAFGNMRDDTLDNAELDSYLPRSDGWQTVFRHIAAVTDTKWLWLDGNRFYILFQTSSGDTYLATGWEDTAERHTESDDTRITHLCRLTKDENAEEKELAWFDATVLEAQTTLLRVTPVYGSWEAEQYGELEVSRYYIIPDTEMCGLTLMPGEFTEGDRVRIVYDGQIQETYPARINKTYSITKLPALDYVAYNSINEAILDGCVAIVNGDAVAGQELWKNFIRLSQNGTPTSIQYVTYFTVGDSRHMAADLFQQEWERYPTMYIHELTFDGNKYQIRWLEGDTEYVQTWKYLMHYTVTPPNGNGTFQHCDCYILTDRNDVFYEDLMNGMYSADFNDQIPFKQVYTDYTYGNEPSFAELEAAKTALEPYMIEYKINFLDANELTQRLDVGVSEWVDGLEDLIEQYLDLEFVTITPQNGTLEFTDRNDLHTRFPDYFGLDTFKGLELYALEDGYVLMSGTNRNKTEDEINALPRATAEEMKEILKSYQPGPGGVIALDEIFVYNRTSRSEREIRQELGILPQWEVSLEVTHATSAEALIVYHINNLGPGEVWTGYDYHLEVLTDEGWVHYGYPPEELAWEDALLFHATNHYPLDSQNQEIFVADWSRTANVPLPPGTYRYCKGVTIYYDGEYTNQTLHAVFDVPKDSPEIPGVYMEILNPTDTGATLAITYNGGLMGELSTQGKYYLMVDEGGGMTMYGLTPSKVAWDDVLYTLKEGETVYLDVRWDHTAEAPLPTGFYHVVLIVDQNVPDNGAVFQFQKYITGPFAITD